MKILFVGDINLGEYYPSIGNGPGTFAETNYLFSEVQSIIDECDFCVGNLEASITSKGWSSNNPEDLILKVKPSVAGQLKKAKFKVLQVANNHAIQHGDESFNESLKILDDLKINPVGLKSQKLVRVSANDVSIGFLAASDVPDNTYRDQDTYQKINEEFSRLVKESVSEVDHLVVMLHWGLEESPVPLPYQREYAKQLKEMGVSVIIGSHPHIFYEISKVNGFMSAYSLGNFIFDLCWDERLSRSGALQIEFSKNSISGKVWPISLKKNGSLPTITGSPITIDDNVVLYDNGKSVKWQRVRKVVYMAKNILKGKTRLKIRFLMSKVVSTIGISK